jgi:hypothetical protein
MASLGMRSLSKFSVNTAANNKLYLGTRRKTMSQATMMRTKAGGYVVLLWENIEQLKQMTLAIREILTDAPANSVPTAEAYKADLLIVSGAQQLFGTERVFYYDYRWPNEVAIRKWLQTGDPPNLGALPPHLKKVLGTA